VFEKFVGVWKADRQGNGWMDGKLQLWGNWLVDDSIGCGKCSNEIGIVRIEVRKCKPQKWT